MPRQLIQTERHRGRRRLEPSHEKGKRLRRHLLNRQRTLIRGLPQIDQQLQEVPPRNVMRLPVRHSVSNHLHKKIAHLLAHRSKAEEFPECGEGEGDKTTNGLRLADGEDELSVFAERGVLLFEAFALQTEGTGTDYVGGEAGEDFFGVERLARFAVVLGGFLKTGRTFHQGGEHHL